MTGTGYATAKRSTAVALAATVLVALPLSAQAKKLPETAVKLTAAETKALYSGKASNWRTSKAFFAPDGTFLLVKKDRSLIGEGKWTVKGNKVCTKAKWYSLKDGSSDNFWDCWTWYKDGRKYWTQWKGSSGSSEGFYDNEKRKLIGINTVSAQFKRLKAKLN